MRILAIDTALGACAACVLSLEDNTLLARESIAMERGHAEALLPLLDRIMAGIDGGFESLDRIAVTVGPGSYTGLRVGISAARAIGLAATIPVVGVATLAAYLAPLVRDDPKRVAAAAIDAKHGQIYVQAIAPGSRAIIVPSAMPLREAVRVLGSGPVNITGSGAALLAAECWAQGIEALVAEAPSAPDIAYVAQLGALADPRHALPKPLYLRGPDAKPHEAILPQAKPAEKVEEESLPDETDTALS